MKSVNKLLFTLHQFYMFQFRTVNTRGTHKRQKYCGPFYLFFYLLSFGPLLHIKKTKNKKKQKQNGQGSRYSIANYSGPLKADFTYFET